MTPLTASPEGPVTLAAPQGLSQALMSSLQWHVREHLPGVQLDIVSEPIELALACVMAGRADFGVVGQPPATAGLRWHALAIEPFLLAGIDRSGRANQLLVPVGPPGPGYAGRLPGIRLADAMALPLLMQTRAVEARRKLDAMCASLGLTPNVVYETDSIEMLNALYLGGHGFVFINSAIFAQDPIPPGGVRARLVQPEFTRTLGLAWLPAHPLSRAGLAVIGLLRSEFATAIRSGYWLADSVDSQDSGLDQSLASGA